MPEMKRNTNDQGKLKMTFSHFRLCAVELITAKAAPPFFQCQKEIFYCRKPGVSKNMFASHRPRVYRSARGCCICGSKSSSSRFTSSDKYEEDFPACFEVNEGSRTGLICNACVLLVKRWQKLPEESKRSWSHVGQCFALKSSDVLILILSLFLVKGCRWQMQNKKEFSQVVEYHKGGCDVAKFRRSFRSFW